MKVFLDTVGCRLNQAELELMALQFRASGHDIVGAAENADLAVVNTCSVTSTAASDSRSAVRRVARGCPEVVVTGCWATLRPEDAAALPRVGRVIANGYKDGLVARLLGLPEVAIDPELSTRIPLPGSRWRTRAFIKVQDGCDNRCTFCVTTIARGPGRSKPAERVIMEVHAALAGAAREIVLTGVHLGSWGHDFGRSLSDLVSSILLETEVPRLRLSSLEPWDLKPEFFRLWADHRLCSHLHLPLQSGCASTLRRMGRKTTPDSFRALIAAARDAIPGVAITTDLIAGFPGESEAEFRESLDYVRALELAGGHAFTYSPMSGTVAARMQGHLALEVRRQRSQEYIQALGDAALAFRKRRIGETRPVLWERVISPVAPSGLWRLSGLTDNYIRVHADSREPRWNMIDAVELGENGPDGLRGIIRKMG